MTRTDRLEQMSRQAQVRLDAARFAADLGIRTDALLAEAAVLAAQFQAVPAVGWRALSAEIARERGLDPSEVWTETARILRRGM